LNREINLGTDPKNLYPCDQNTKFEHYSSLSLSEAEFIFTDLLSFFSHSSTPSQSLQSSIMTQPKKDIVVAIDFGTTFSGIAWAHTANVVEREARYFECVIC
jgi:hypothetical protein